MPKDDMNLTCRQCGREFLFTVAEQGFYEMKGFTLPGRCRECRQTKQEPSRQVVCSQCGTELERGASRYCADCLTDAHLEFELKTKQSKQAASAAYSKLLVSESQKAELAELLRQKEQLVETLELEVDYLSQDLDKAYQFQAFLGPLQPALDGIEERLAALEITQNKISERMLQLAQRMHEMNEMYETTGLLDIIKRSLRRYERQIT